METLNNLNTNETKNHNNNMMHKIVVTKNSTKSTMFSLFDIAKTFASVFCGYMISRHEERITIDIEIFIAVANCT